MKTWIILTSLVLSLLCGCGTPKQVAYKTLASVGLAVNSAADSYALARSQGLVTDVDWAQAVDVHNKFLVSYRAAVTLASGDVQAYAPEALVKLEMEVLNAFAKRN